MRSVVVRVVGARLDGKPMPEPESAVGVVVGRTTWLRTAGETVEEMLARVRLMSEPHRRNAIPTMTLAF